MVNDKSKAGNLPFTDEPTGISFIDIATYKPGPSFALKELVKIVQFSLTI